MRLWIDTDVGDDPDDAIALLCAAASPAVELVGVSTVDGDRDRRAALAHAIVDAPVFAGDVPELGAALADLAPEAFLGDRSPDQRRGPLDRRDHAAADHPDGRRARYRPPLGP